MVCAIHAKEGRIFSPLLYFPSECAIIRAEAPECRRSEIKLNKETSGAVFSAKDRNRETGKREAGESPARSRHCKQEAIAIMSLSHREGSNGCLNCEPGDLPDCGTGNIGSGSRGLAVPNV